jgi:hypothetical protein
MHCLLLSTTVTSWWWLHKPSSMRCAYIPCSVRKRFKNTQLCRRKSKPCGQTLGSTIRSPVTGSDADHAAVQASGIEKNVVDGCGSKIHTDQRESNLWSGLSNISSYRSDLACLLQQWLFHVAVLVRRCSPALAAIVIALILQSQKLTALCCSAVYSTTPERSIQQSNRQVPSSS